MAHIVEMGDGKLLSKLPALGAQLSGLDVLAGGGVVQYNGDFLPVKHRGQTRLFKFRDGHRRGDVVAQHQVQLSLDALTRLHMVQPGGPGQNFLGHGHSHGLIPPRVLFCGFSMTERLHEECNI